MGEPATITSREYKVILEHRLFVDLKPAACAFLGDLNGALRRLSCVKSQGEFKKTKKREVTFLDTFDFNYDADLLTPTWTAYRLTAADLESTVTRKDCFRSDPRLPGEQAATCEDYDEPIFDRGHMASGAFRGAASRGSE